MLASLRKSKSTFLCALILAFTVLIKVFALAHGSGTLASPHPFLPGTFRFWVSVALAAELLGFVVLAFAGSREFAAFCLGLGALIIAYHAVQVGLDIKGPCPCLGSMLSRWKPLSGAEQLLSFLLASLLSTAAFLGFFEKFNAVEPENGSLRNDWRFWAGTSAGLWVLLSFALAVLWKDRVLGGDEGLEAAKALQWLRMPSEWLRVWNDQPPLLSFIGALALKLGHEDMQAVRFCSILLCLGLPLSLACYFGQMRMPWGAPIAAAFLWFAFPTIWGVFMQEGPAYALGLASLIPLCGDPKGSRLRLIISSSIAAFALSIKLTAAFALLVPFIFLCQQSALKPLIWGSLAVLIVVVLSCILPGWSWNTILISHFQGTKLGMEQFHLRANAYTDAWLLCIFSLFAVGNRYLRQALRPVMPWIVAAITSILIHILHKPFYLYYNLHLIAPLAVLAAVGLLDLLVLAENFTLRGELSRMERGAIIAGAGSLICVWIFVGLASLRHHFQMTAPISASDVVAGLRSLRSRGEEAFSLDPLWTFSADMTQSPPELTFVSLKRFWSGEISEAAIAGILLSNRIGGAVLTEEAVGRSAWKEFVAHYGPVARTGGSVLFARKDLHFKEIDLKDQSALYSRLGLTARDSKGFRDSSASSAK